MVRSGAMGALALIVTVTMFQSCEPASGVTHGSESFPGPKPAPDIAVSFSIFWCM
jgi:hypothetical protein